MFAKLKVYVIMSSYPQLLLVLHIGITQDTQKALRTYAEKRG